MIQWCAEEEFSAGISNYAFAISAPCRFLPELLPVDGHGKVQQITEDIIGPFELHDYFLYHMVRYGEGPAKITYMAELAFGSKTYDGNCSSVA